MGMEVDQIAKALDRDHGARYAFWPVQARAEELFETLIGAPAELSQELKALITRPAFISATPGP